jgi:hypothetical protein
MASDHLQIADILANQNAKEVTHNTAINKLDRSSNQRSTKAITVSTSLTTTEARENGIIELTGTPGAPFTLNMPDTNQRMMVIYNNTDGQCTVRNSAGGGTGQPVLTVGEATVFHYDGTNFIDVNALATLVSAFTDLSDVPGSYSGNAEKGLRVNTGETALEPWSLLIWRRSVVEARRAEASMFATSHSSQARWWNSAPTRPLAPAPSPLFRGTRLLIRRPIRGASSGSARMSPSLMRM